MKTILTAFLLGSVSLPLSHGTPSQQALPEYNTLVEELVNLSPDPTAVAAVRNITLKRDRATFELQEGTLYFCKPVRNRIVAAAFVGKGTFSMTPPTGIEQNQIYRFFEKTSLNEEFTFLFLLFGDSTTDEMKAKLDVRDGRIPSDLESDLDFATKFLGNRFSDDLKPSFVKTFLEGWTNSLFHAHFSLEATRPLFFEIDPFEEEEVRFMKRAKETVYFVTDIVSQFHLQEENTKDYDYQADYKDDLSISRKRIDVAFDEDFRVTGEMAVEFQSRKRQQYIAFYIYRDVHVTSVRLQDGTALDFSRNDDGWQVWVKLNRPLDEGAYSALKIQFEGEVIEKGRFSGRVFTKSGHYWYPRFSGRSKPEYDLYFTYSPMLELVGTGKEISTIGQGESKVSHWRVDPGAHNVSFSIGSYEKRLVESPGVPPVTFFEMSEVYRTGSRWDINLVSLDVANAVQFFEELYGECPVDHLYAIEVPQSHSEAFPGILHISELASHRTSWGVELHRSHEVAHQWWGVGVDTETYHDQWLAESFSTYSSLMYAQYVLGNSERFFEALSAWEEKILDNREYLFGGGMEEGPISLGYRTEGEETSGDMHLVIYLKGAYVLHMLRVMLLDLRSMSEGRFAGMMKEFYSSFTGKEASTADFQRVVEKYSGDSMDWFFNQWVHGTEIPVYRFAYRITELPDRKYSVQCRVRQEGVSPDFHMPVPISVRLEDGREMLFRFPIVGEGMEFELPSFSSKPEEVVFNAMNGVLSEVRVEEWNE